MYLNSVLVQLSIQTEPNCVQPKAVPTKAPIKTTDNNNNFCISIKNLFRIYIIILSIT